MDDRTATDETLVRAVHAGRSSAFDAIYLLHRRRVEAICRRYLSDPRDVEEAVQDTFLKAARALSGFNGSFRLGAWLARIAVNTAIDHSRRQRSRTDLPTVIPDDRADSGIDIESEVLDREGPGHDILKELNPDYGAALKMRTLEGASHAEIGAALGKSPKQVKALLHRAREAFRKRWGEVASTAAFVAVAGGILVGTRLMRGPLVTITNGAVPARVGDAMAAPMASVIAEGLPV